LDAHQASYYLWRGLAYHALGRAIRVGPPSCPAEKNPLIQATLNYSRALTLAGRGDVPLTAEEQERAHSGLGWLSLQVRAV